MFKIKKLRIKIPIQRKIIDRIFEIGILMKSLFGFFEVLAGIFIAVSGKRLVNNFIIDMAQQEVMGDPNDTIANFLINSANNFYYNAHIFAIAYLLIHGVINIVLATALMKNRLWAFPWAIVSFGSFIFYQSYRYIYTHSPSLLFLTIFDIFIVSVIWVEYSKRKKGEILS